MAHAPQLTASSFERFLASESAPGIILMLAAMAAIIVANSPLAPIYGLLLDTPVSIRVSELSIDKPLLLWINDGLMAVFFFMIGLELKREVLEGELSDPTNRILPGIGAVGGMAVPAAIYLFFNGSDEGASQGWAIPAATDIAFALGVLSLLGSRVPVSLKVFLTSLAIFDDVGAIVIIALFYTANISIFALMMAAICLPLLYWLNRRAGISAAPFILIGMVVWVAVLKSGVHATLAGVLLALFIPIKSKKDPNYSPLKTMEHGLHTPVFFVILPIFAFANAGVDIRGIGLDQVLHPVPVGIAAGLFLGKPLGIFLPCLLAVRLGIAKMPKGMTLSGLLGVSALCGIGFTMSLFIGSLAFEETGFNQLFDERLGIIVGSMASGLLGYFVLRKTLPKDAQKPTDSA